MHANLLVFICDSLYQALEYAAWSGQLDFASRCFIMTAEKLDKSRISWIKPTDIVLNLNNISQRKDKLEIAIRGALVYSTPKYENILILLNNEIPQIDVCKKLIQEVNKTFDFKIQSNVACIPREYFVLNGFDFINKLETNPDEVIYDEVSLGMDVGLALSGMPCKTLPFVEAIKEIISLDKINLHSSALKELNKYQVYIDRLIKASQNKTSDSSLLIISEDLSESEIEKLKTGMTNEGVILYFTESDNIPNNLYKIILHESGTKAILIR
jgi:hypothetical protein